MSDTFSTVLLYIVVTFNFLWHEYKFWNCSTKQAVCQPSPSDLRALESENSSGSFSTNVVPCERTIHPTVTNIIKIRFLPFNYWFQRGAKQVLAWYAPIFHAMANTGRIHTSGSISRIARPIFCNNWRFLPTMEKYFFASFFFFDAHYRKYSTNLTCHMKNTHIQVFLYPVTCPFDSDDFTFEFAIFFQSFQTFGFAPKAV